MAFLLLEALSSIISKLTVFNILFLSLACMALGTLYQIIYYRFFHPLKNFPGPFWASFTRLWIAYHSFKGDEHTLLWELHQKYGPIMRISPTLLAVSDSTKLPDIYHRYADKSKHFITGSFGKTEMVFNMQNWKEHAYHRKLIAGPYSFTNIKKMEPLVDVRIERWIKKMDELFACKRQKFDFAPWAVYMAYDVISEVGFGAPFGFVESGTDIGGLIQAFHDGLPLFGVVSRLYPFTEWIKSTWLGEKYFVVTPEHKSGFGTIMRFRDRLINERIEDIKMGKASGRVDLIQHFLSVRTENGDLLPIDYVKAESMLVLLAGSDTTGTALQTLILHILSSPRIYTRLMQEIDTATTSGHLSLAGIPQYEDVIQHCPFYIACVKESLRLYPPALGLTPRIMSKGGVELCGRWVPEGTEVTSTPWTINRDIGVYGSDVGVYRPERWLEDGEEKIKAYHKSAFWFSYGSRVCLGKDLALLELYKAGVAFLKTFNVKLLKEKPSSFTVKGGIGFWSDIWVEIKRRELAT